MAENTLEPKTIPDVVAFCPLCSCEFAEKASANEYHQCGNCQNNFKVTVK